VRKYWRVTRHCESTETLIVIDETGIMTTQEIKDASEGMEGRDNNDLMVADLDVTETDAQEADDVLGLLDDEEGG
jgi:hypothetical protein